MEKPPFSIRQDPQRSEEYFALTDDIPDYLLPSLLAWVAAHYSHIWAGKRRVKADQLHQLERKRRQLVPRDAQRDLSELQRAFVSDHFLLLDAIDVVLHKHWGASLFEEDSPSDLEAMLQEGSSAYCVRDCEDGTYELQRRQPAEMMLLLEESINDHGRASDHLSRAWSQCFGRDTNLNEACIEAAKAVEVAAKPLVTPDDPRATLGKMCSAIEIKPSKWETDLEYTHDVQTILHMMRFVWEGQLRHGDENAPLEVTEEGAQMIVSAAVLLVTWFSSGRIRLRNVDGV